MRPTHLFAVLALVLGVLLRCSSGMDDVIRLELPLSDGSMPPLPQPPANWTVRPTISNYTSAVARSQWMDTGGDSLLALYLKLEIHLPTREMSPAAWLAAVGAPDAEEDAKALTMTNEWMFINSQQISQTLVQQSFPAAFNHDDIAAALMVTGECSDAVNLTRREARTQRKYLEIFPGLGGSGLLVNLQAALELGQFHMALGSQLTKNKQPLINQESLLYTLLTLAMPPYLALREVMPRAAVDAWFSAWGTVGSLMGIKWGYLPQNPIEASHLAKAILWTSTAYSKSYSGRDASKLIQLFLKSPGSQPAQEGPTGLDTDLGALSVQDSARFGSAGGADSQSSRPGLVLEDVVGSAL